MGQVESVTAGTAGIGQAGNAGTSSVVPGRTARLPPEPPYAQGVGNEVAIEFSIGSVPNVILITVRLTLANPARPLPTGKFAVPGWHCSSLERDRHCTRRLA
jgi:hypothetical protein